ncbi:molybdopterin-dependent oxidoreductase [Maricurvus nonylphenolicus]|uniref:molybdopterin-containing oxidoreductase family protein n=1 Tax=Maricurvus nonylphenolicus TaxID=1008307 RepID=UPI0036F3FB1F
MERKHVNCATCDIACQLVATRDGEGRYSLEGDYDNPLAPGAICAKGKLAHEIFEHPNRLTQPLKRVGERGGGQWEPISWDQAMDEIAAKLSDVVNKYGPESLVVSSGPWNCSTESGMTRRFMNLLGTPNYISPVALCLGNTAAVHRLTYGWLPAPDYEHTECIVLFGHNPHKQSWVMEYIRIRLAQERGAKLIVLDPRQSQSADRSDIHLPLRLGTDAAMCLGWINVIITEELYDKAFVEKWTVGFEQLKERVLNDYSLEKVAAITGVDEDSIRQAARMYANAKSAVIPWSPITDQQNSSTSAIRAQSILRALTGNLDVPGGDLLMGINPDIVAESALELHEQLPLEQKEKQFGFNEHPVFTYNATEKLRKPSLRVWGTEYPNQVKGTCMAVPSPTFRAMAYGDPYPAKAFISIANNALQGYANQKLIHDALMNQDLVVCHELFMTPTASLSDYVLPGDTWMERPNLHDAFEWFSLVQSSQQLYEPVAECKNIYFFWHELAKRMGMEDYFPWKDLTELYDYRLAHTGLTLEQFQGKYKIKIAEVKYYKYQETGFATPSGKVELYSSMLDDWGLDPLPYHRNSPEPCQTYPLKMFVGVREPQFFQSGQRHVKALRKSNKNPKIFVSANTASNYALVDQGWAKIETINGRIRMQVMIREDMPDGLVRVPHGWWLPEHDDLGIWEHADGILAPDTEEYLDREQGIPHLKGIPCRVSPIKSATSWEAL